MQKAQCVPEVGNARSPDDFCLSTLIREGAQ